MKLSPKPRVIVIADPNFGNYSYPYVFAGIPRAMKTIATEVLYLNPKTATAQSFRRDIERFKPELLFGFIQKRQQLAKIAGFLKQFHPIPAINWSLEDPNFVVGTKDDKNMIEFSESFDMWFCNDSKMVPFWRTKAAFMPPGFDERVYYDAGIKRCYEVSYIGQLGPKIATQMYWPYMKEMAGYGKKAMLCIDRPMGIPLLPKPFEKFLRSKKRRRFFQKIPLWKCTWHNPGDETEKAHIINQSKIHVGLNRVRGSWEEKLKALIPDYPLDKHGLFYQLKGRLFHTVGAGAMVLNEYCPELEDMFEIDKEIITFKFGNLEEFRDKLAWYIAHDREREQVAKAGYERGRKQHTFSARIQQILSIVRERL